MKNIVDLTRIMVLSFNDSNTGRCQEMDCQAVGSEEPNAEAESTSGALKPSSVSITIALWTFLYES